MPQALPIIALALHAVEGIAWINTLAQAMTLASVMQGVGAVQKQNSEKKAQGGLISLELNPSAPRRLVVGKRAIAGTLVDWYVGGSNNVKLYMPVYLSEGPCGTITKVWAGGRVVWNTPLVHGVRTVLPGFRSGGDRLWLTYYDGRVGQTADATLVGLGQGWTSANKMTGCAYVLIECQWDSDNLRAPPQFMFEFEGAKLYDRRKDTTAGGSGSHRLNDPSTWELPDSEGANPAVALDHYQLGRYWSGQRVFGIGMSPEDVPYDRFAAQANICDENVTKKAGGTQKRYRANGVILANEQYDDTIKRFCAAMAAEPADFGGRVGVVGIEARTPVLTIDDDDLIDGSTEMFSPKRTWGELVGAVEGKFQDPAQNYQATPYPEVTDAAWATQDGGEPKRITYDFDFEIDVERAQRLALLKARYERRQATLKGTYPLWAIELERGDWFVRTGRAGSRFGEAGKTFEVMDRIFDAKTGLVTIAAKEVDASDSAWVASTAQDGPPAPIAGTATLSAVQVPAISVLGVTLSGTAATIPALKVSWTSPTDARVRFLYVEVENVDGVTPKTTKTIALPSDVNEIIFQDGVVDGDSYAISAKFLTDTIQSDWCVAEIVAASGTYAVGSASSVPWSGVTGSGKPADNATKNTVTFDATAPPSPTNGDFWVDTSSTPYVIKSRVGGAWQTSASYGGVFGGTLYEAGGGSVATLANFKTILGVASGITGQGWGATADENTIKAAQGFGLAKNARFAVPFTSPGIPTNWSPWGTNNATFITRAIGPGKCMEQIGGVGQNDGFSQNIPIYPGKYLLTAEVRRSGGSLTGAGVYAAFYNASNTYLGDAYLVFATTANTAGVTSSTPDGAVRFEKVITAPAGTAYCLLYCMTHASAMGSVAVANSLEWYECDLRAQSLVSQVGADVTATNTAAGVTGQGALATKNTVGAGDISVASLAAISATIGLLRTATSGARTEIEDNVIRVYDSSGTLRVRMGVW